MASRSNARVIVVPGEYRGEFERDMDGALRNLAGIATESMSPLFRDKTVILRCISKERVHPFTRAEISTSTADDLHIETYFRAEAMFKIHMSRYVVREDPDAPRFVGIDIGLVHDLLKTFRREALHRQLGPDRLAAYFAHELALEQMLDGCDARPIILIYDANEGVDLLSRMMTRCRKRS